MPARMMPFPSFTFAYIRNALVIWGLLRVALALRGIANPQGLSAVLLIGLAVAIAWFEHRRSHENFFHSSLGGRLWIPLASALLLVSVLEFIL